MWKNKNYLFYKNRNLKILLIKLRYIGDTITLIPVVENLKSRFHDFVVHVMVRKGTEEILRYHPMIDRIWIYDNNRAKGKSKRDVISYHMKLYSSLRRQKFDVVIDFTLGDRATLIAFMTGAPLRVTFKEASRLAHLLMNTKINADSQRHIVEYQLESLKIFGINDPIPNYTIYIPEQVQYRIDSLLKRYELLDGKPLICIHPGARNRLRRWSPQRFAHIADRLIHIFNAHVTLIGGPKESSLLEDVERFMRYSPSFKTTQFSLLEMAALFKRSDLLIGNDSAPVHIAAGVGCSTLTLYGPTFPHTWHPLSPKGEYVFKGLSCCGCRQLRCERPDDSCMDQISVEDVWEKVVKILKH